MTASARYSSFANGFQRGNDDDLRSQFSSLWAGSSVNPRFSIPTASIGSSPGRKKDQFYRNRNDVLEWQFWPSAVAMGSLSNRDFFQMFGAECEYGRDTRKDDQFIAPQPNRPLPARVQDRGWGKSYLAFDFHREYLIIKSRLCLPPSNLPPALRPIDAEMPFNDIAAQGFRIQEVGVIGRDPVDRTKVIKEVSVTVCTRRPPKFYTEFAEIDRMPNMRGKEPYRRRATAMDFAMGAINERTAGTINVMPDGPSSYPTYWNTWRWSFKLNEADLSKLYKCQAKLRMIEAEDPQMQLVGEGKLERSLKRMDAESHRRNYGPPDLSALTFAPRSLIEGLISRGILKPGDTPALVDELRKVAVVMEFRCKILESLYTYDLIRDIRKTVQSKARYLRRHAPPVLDHLVLVRTVQITPTRVLVSPPRQEPSNSVTRRYADRLDGIIRVVFTDEEDRLFVQDYTKSCDLARPDLGVMARIRRALQHGIKIGGEIFFPVASSASQQKEHALWFINHRLIDGVELRNWMGSVAETVVAKHAARMGLPFSSTRSVNLNIDLGPQLLDVERNGYCFTDGCAVAGMEVMKQAAKAFNHKGLNANPSAIQFRLGGAKGVLSYWPGLVGPHEVRLRKSLVKFESKLADLNVVRIAKYQTAFLNRQFIMIMCANGIPESLMIDIFRDAIADIHGLKTRVVEQRMTKSDRDLISTCSDFPLNALIKAGFHENPFLQDLCDIIECRALQDLKWRARVKLDSGVFLIGIADESGTLREGEIFCQYQENEDTAAKIVRCEVLVCRAPALHPGDVRRAQAVDRPELRHLKNVVVFSTQGKRDLPNMLGGGDLDGDDYTIIWDQRFVQYLQEYAPMDYTAPPPIRAERVTQLHLNENFVNYILNDVLGQVDNTHLALADAGSPSSQECLKLAEIHSTAVDFAKTGQKAELPQTLKPREWPDFMDRDGMKLTYESNKILGHLFRLVQPDPCFRPCDIRELNYPIDARLTDMPISTHLMDLLKPIKRAYDHEMSSDMRKYRVLEPEIPSGLAIRNKRRKGPRDSNLNEPLRDAYNVHVRHFREEAMKAVQSVTFRGRLTAAQSVARHCYALTYQREYVEANELEGRRDHLEEEGDEGGYLRPIPLISFAWIFWQELVQIVQRDLL